VQIKIRHAGQGLQRDVPGAAEHQMLVHLVADRMGNTTVSAGPPVSESPDRD